MDFEDNLDLYIMRKKTDRFQCSETTVEHKKNSKHVTSFKGARNCIPLLLKDVKCLNKNWKDETDIKIFADKVQFKHCLIYGKIMSHSKELKTSYNYILDDGTACLDIFIFKKTNDIQTIRIMESELHAISRNMLAQNKEEIVNSLRSLLNRTKEQINNASIPMGAKVLLYGKPTCYRNQTSFKVFSFIEDEKSNRDTEIFFKDYLINWYKANCV